MATRRGVWAVCIVTATAAAGSCGSREPAAPTDSTAQMTLYSIDGSYMEREGAKLDPGTEMLHGYPVIGKRDVVDGDERAMLSAALDDGVKQSDGTLARCFWPRHALRVVENGKTIEYVICFECLQMVVHQDGVSSTKPITQSPAEAFNKALRDGGVPLAPP